MAPNDSDKGTSAGFGQDSFWKYLGLKDTPPEMKVMVAGAFMIAVSATILCLAGKMPWYVVVVGWVFMIGSIIIGIRMSRKL